MIVSRKNICSVSAVFLLCAASVFGLPQNQEVHENAQPDKRPKAPKFTCPEPFGFFEDPAQCDKYWECEQGVATPKLCDDGLVFDYLKAGRDDPCDSPYVVDCGERKELQPPTYPSEFCPRKHGFFADPDRSICDVFYTCKGGRSVKTPCSPSLHFNEETGTCNWPAAANRIGCGEKKPVSVNGFTCPKEEVIDDRNMRIPHPTYPDLVDCQKFYVCLNGETPQESSCELGKVYNERKSLCEIPSKVPECDGWYQDDPRFAHFYDYQSALEGPDPGVQDTVL